MKLVKLQSLTNRPITNIELVSRYLFGADLPKEFTPGIYEADSYAYVVNGNHSATIYYCLETAYYSTIDADRWIVASVPSIVARLISQIQGDGSTEETVNAYSDMSYETYTDLPRNGSILTLPFEYQSVYQDIHVYKNGLRLFINKGDYVISRNHLEITSDLLLDDLVVVDVFYKNTPQTRLLYTMENDNITATATEDGGIVIEIDVPEYIMMKSNVFDLYAGGKYIPEESYSTEYNAATLTYVLTFDSTERNRWALEEDLDYNSIFTCSISKEVTIVKNDVVATAIDETSQFQLDLRYTDFKDISEIHNSYCSGKVIPNTSVVLYNSTAHIEDSNFYLQRGDMYIISYKNIVTSSVFANDDETSNDFIDTVYVSHDMVDLKRIPIPFIDYNPDYNTLLLFKGDGYLISSTRYYIKDNILKFYPHDDSLVWGDRITFQILNNDYTVGSYMKAITVTEVDMANGISLPLLSYTKDLFDVLIFTKSGMLLTPNRYELNGYTVKLKDNAGVEEGDIIEFVFFEYISTITNTTMKVYETTPTSETSVDIPFEYSNSNDNIIIFQSNGMYLDKSRYIINVDGVVNLTAGTEFNLTDAVYILRSHRFDSAISILNVPALR